MTNGDKFSVRMYVLVQVCAAHVLVCMVEGINHDREDRPSGPS